VPHILDVTGDDIARLSDADLRTLVARLALAELGSQGLPLSGVTAGGHQDAADGGVDVRVDCEVALPKPDFVPRALTGFQVKKPDMPASAIDTEMRPKGDLRSSIRALIERKGAYIIVSAQGSVSDAPLKDRREAMRHALQDENSAEDLATDFYDRDRMALWANVYPGVAAWVRTRTGRAVQGWGPVGTWLGTGINKGIPFLSSDAACIIDETRAPPATVTVIDGIARLRTLLATPRTCVRLVGLSGLGKTRLVHALFEDAMGDNALDASLALYTDYGVEPATSARDMAQQLVGENTRAILVVDNCNGATHAVLTAICRDPGSNTSLLTVEYDVRDDEPEETDVFRLQPASPALVADWLNVAHPHVSQVDAVAIAEFSDGNFRLAAALAGTVKKGKSLGSLKGQALFDRLFHQRQGEDKTLRKAAEELALLYSVDASSTAEDGELAQLGRIRDVPASALFDALAELRARGLLQSRGRYRAILPQAIANPLASDALERIAPDAVDQFVAKLAPRMLRSFAHRLGFLSDSTEACGVLARWMAPGGRLGNFAVLDFEHMRLLAALAPLAPDAVLAKAAMMLTQPVIDDMDDIQARGAWVRLVFALAFDTASFEVAATLLSRFLIAEGDADRYHEARDAFAQLFRVQYSGTCAKPVARRAILDALARVPAMARCARVALDALLDPSSHSPYGWPTFGAQSRDWGWMPGVEAEYTAWFDEAIAMAVGFDNAAVDGRGLIAKHFPTLWRIEACRKSLEDACTRLAATSSWTDGWLAARRTAQFLRFHGLPDDARLSALVEALAPTTLLERATATVMGGSTYDTLADDEQSADAQDGWSPADKAALRIGRELAMDATTRAVFIPILVARTTMTRALVCGQGLFEGSVEPCVIWAELLDAYVQCQTDARDIALHAGFMRAWHDADHKSSEAALQHLVTNASLAPLLPALEGSLPLGEEGASRLMAAIGQGLLSAGQFRTLAAIAVQATPAGALAALVRAIGEMSDGPGVALDMLHSRLFNEHRRGQATAPALIEAGRFLFERFDFSGMETMRDYYMQRLIAVCLSGKEGAHATQIACTRLRARFDTLALHAYQLTHTMPALFQAQPTVALDAFLLRDGGKRAPRFWRADREFGEFLDTLPPATLVEWANIDPSERFAVLAEAMTLFVGRRGAGNGNLSDTFLAVLDHAADKSTFLGELYNRLQPTSWSGSLAVLIDERVNALRALSPQPAGLPEWLDANNEHLARWIAAERSRDGEDEQAFE
jgi:hypothetical protein